MLLKNLEISGFKSFAKKSFLEFGAPISAIVGPNGSGKSNIAEAFRFVLGEQSIKSLRGKKGEDMIFNGSPEVGRMNRAGVKITFDNSRRFLNLDFDEVTIERIVHRDSLNEYFINGSAVRLKDILELLAGAHIGSSGHHIISQGEADKILNASFKERKAMVEDALGLKIYQYKRKESEKKLFKTEENIKSVESLRREIAPHLKFLKKQVEKVEKAFQMKEELRNLYKDYLKREDTYLKESRKNLENAVAPLKQEEKRLAEELLRAKEVLARSAGKDGKNPEIISLEEKIKAVREQKDALYRDIGRLEGELASEERILKKQKELADGNMQRVVYLRDVESALAEAEAKIAEGEAGDTLEKVKGALRAVRDIFVGFISRNKEKTDDSLLKDTENEIAKLGQDKKAVEEKIISIKSEEEKLNAEYLRQKEAVEKEKDSGRDAEKAMFRIMSEQNEIISKINAVKVTEDRLRMEEENLKRELAEGAVLIGRDILDFAGYAVLDQSGQAVSSENMLKEDRRSQEDRRRAIEKIKLRIEDAGAGGGEDVMKEFREASERDAFLGRELEDLHKSADSLKQLIFDLGARLGAEFKSGVEKINKQFGEFFSTMFGGGEAELVVVEEKKKKKLSDEEALLEGGLESFDEEDEDGELVEEGIDIKVSLPRKKIKGLAMLSGGERALTSIALLFAVSQVNPPPFIILDETDAALDEANSRKYGDMISNLSKYSQLILITHNRETMSRAGIIYGVTMGSGGVSKILSIQFEEAVSVAK